jgi:hypothetical protein
MKWIVRRHSGKLSGSWLNLFAADDESAAMLVYDQVAANLRQGVVQLVDPRGNVAAVESVPRLVEILNASQPYPRRWWFLIRRAFGSAS